jgi:hypothetical protein
MEPTPMLSRYTLWGRRRGFRRKEDRQKGGYVDRYSAKLLLFLTLILGLNILDVIFTMMILHLGGIEVNPIVEAVIGCFGDRFWLWKFGIVSFNVVILCIHSKFKTVKLAILAVTLVYMAVVIYQIFLLSGHPISPFPK